MADAYDSEGADYGLSLDMIEESIEAGLPMHADRLTRAYVNEEYYHCRNAAFLRPRSSEDWLDFCSRPKRTSKLVYKVIRKLTELDYAPGPTRKLENGTYADEYLQRIYGKNRVNAIMAQANRKAALNGACLIGAEATSDDRKPIDLAVWGAHEFVAFPHPNDPCEVWAVVTIMRQQKPDRGRFKEQLRYTAWSAREHRVYLTEWRDVPNVQANDYARQCYSHLFCCSATYQPALSGWSEAGEHHEGHNPYGRLPFMLFSNEARVSCLYEGAIGDPLVECVAELDRALSDVGAHTQEFMDPDRFMRNVGTGFRREKNRKWWQILPPLAGAKQGDNNLEPEAFLVQGQLATEQVWMDIRNYADMTIEELDLPLITVRADASTDISGIAIVAKQLPMLQRAKQRQQEPLTQHEVDLASMVLGVAGNFYGDEALKAAAEDTKLAVLWPEPSFPLPTPERDAEDQADIDAGRKSHVQVVAERNGMTTDQAKAHLERVVDENKWYADMLKAKGVSPEPEPAPPQDKGQDQIQIQDGEGPAPAADPNEDEMTDE